MAALVHLSRYSAEFTIYREVLQNANDAGASVVSIDLQTDSDSRAKSMSLQNNGRIFDDADWHRLRSIAEGNPDENKVLLSPRLADVTQFADWLLWCRIL